MQIQPEGGCWMSQICCFSTQECKVSVSLQASKARYLWSLGKHQNKKCNPSMVK